MKFDSVYAATMTFIVIILMFPAIILMNLTWVVCGMIVFLNDVFYIKPHDLHFMSFKEFYEELII